jgi:hypothetical protein
MTSYLETLGFYSKLLGVDLDSAVQDVMDEVMSRSEELIETEEEKLQKQRNKYNKGNSLTFTMDGFEEESIDTSEDGHFPLWGDEDPAGDLYNWGEL